MAQRGYLTPLALLFISLWTAPCGAQSEAATETTAASSGATNFMYELHAAFNLTCDVDNPSGAPVQWTKNGTALALNERITVSGSGGRVLTVGWRSTEDDYGPYACAVGAESREWFVRTRPRLSLPPDSGVVEGQALRLTCRVQGMPRAKVSWSVENASDASFVPVLEAPWLEGRVTLAAADSGAADAELRLSAARKSDAGRFRCSAADAVSTETQLRVKDVYAALWPFLGICAEVAVLCVIILLYERRRTKPELDDSDTDNHDQKKS